MHKAPTLATPTRHCGDCALCCHLGEIVDFKPYNQWCQHCSTQRRCDIYESRPALCRQFYCLYVRGKLAEHWNPLLSHMVVSQHQDPERITVLVDPEAPLIWRESPYLPELQALARTQPVTVMVDTQAFAVYSQRIEDLGELAKDEQIEITEIKTNIVHRFTQHRTKVKASHSPEGLFSSE